MSCGAGGRARIDVIICAGVLYHSAHPFWILEGIAHLAPRLVLIDTLNPARRTALGPPTLRASSTTATGAGPIAAWR